MLPSRYRHLSVSVPVGFPVRDRHAGESYLARNPPGDSLGRRSFSFGGNRSLGRARAIVDCQEDPDICKRPSSSLPPFSSLPIFSIPSPTTRSLPPSTYVLFGSLTSLGCTRAVVVVRDICRADIRGDKTSSSGSCGPRSKPRSPEQRTGVCVCNEDRYRAEDAPQPHFYLYSHTSCQIYIYMRLSHRVRLILYITPRDTARAREH